MNASTESKAPAKRVEVYDPLEMRQLLELNPGYTDPVAMVLWNATYTARTVEEFENCVQASIDALQKALAKVRGE